MTWTSAEHPSFTYSDRGLGLMVSNIGLTATQHDGASFTISVKTDGLLGDGRVELGHLDAVGVAIKSWVGPKADISEIDLGKAFDKPAVGTLITGSIGKTKSSDPIFPSAMGDGTHLISGNVGTMKINGSTGYGLLYIHGGGVGQKHGTITITGSLRGDLPGGDTSDGTVFIQGGGKSITIGGSILNSTLQQQSGGFFGKVTIGGDIVSTSDTSARQTYAATASLVVKGSILGASVLVNSGFQTSIRAFVGGSIVAHDGVHGSGVLTVDDGAQLKSVTVKGSIFGAQFTNWNATGQSDIAAGAIVVCTGSPTTNSTITIGGSIHGGTIANASSAVNGGVQIFGNIASLKIGGSILGYENDPVFILASGKTTPAGDFNAIGKIMIKGSAIHAYIAAGTQMDGSSSMQPPTFNNFNADAGIGSIAIGGDFVHSNVFAGVKDTGTLGVGPTAGTDTLAVGDPARTAKIGPVVIKGGLFGDRAASYSSGFAADVIASITVGGAKLFKAGFGLRSFETNVTAKEL